MTLQEATIIREKFYNGTSSRMEEQAWFAFLCSEACPKEWEADRDVLQALCEPDDVALPAGFVQRLQHRLQAQPGWETCKTEQAAPRVKHYRLWWQRAVGVAAIGVGIFFGLWLYEEGRPSVYRDTCSSPEEALAQMEEAFLLVSEPSGLNYSDVLPDYPID